MYTWMFEMRGKIGLGKAQSSPGPNVLVTSKTINVSDKFEGGNDQVKVLQCGKRM